MKRYVKRSLACKSSSRVDDLRLNRDVERGNGLIADDEFRIDRERPCDADTLPLTAGKFVRITIRVVRLQADEPQEFLRALIAGTPGGDSVNF